VGCQWCSAVMSRGWSEWRMAMPVSPVNPEWLL
jgi:hypothetical protein